MDFAIVITLANEGCQQVRACLTSVRKFYPQVPIHLMSDGVDDPDYKKLAVEFNTDYTLGRYLKRSECAGMWWHRTLTIGLKYKTKWIIKMDPDARFWRAFKSEPRFPLSGTLENAGDAKENIQGGCQAISAQLAQTLLKSGILDGPELRYQRLYCPEPEYMRTWVPTGYFTTDFSMMYMMRKLGLQFGSWREVHSTWRDQPKNPDNQYAVTHPIKMPTPKTGVAINTPLHVIVTCKGRLHHLKQSLPKLLAEKNVQVTLVDYSCPDKCGEWAKRAFPQVRVVKIEGKKNFHLAHARNCGAKATPDGWWCFFDADLLMSPGWAEATRKRLILGHYFIADPLQWSMTGSCILHSSDFKRTYGYDEIITGWACEDIDFYSCLRQVGVRPGFWPGQFGKPIIHGDAERTAFYSREKKESQLISEDYFRRKVDFMMRKWQLPTLAERRMILKTTCDALNVNPDPSPEPIYPPKDLREWGPFGGVPRMPVKRDVIEYDGKVTGSTPSPSLSQNGDIGVIMGTDGCKGTSPFATISGHGSTRTMRKGLGVNISVINESNFHLGLSLPELCDIGNNFIRSILEPLWPGTYATLIPTEVILPHTHAIVLMDDQAHNSQLGYRTRTPDGLPLNRLFVRSTLTSGKPLTHVFTHVVAESRVDPDMNHEAFAADGTIYAQEVCDPVDELGFVLDGAIVANIVTQNWFQNYPGAKFDYMGVLNRPFSLYNPGGMALVRRHGSNWMPIYGSHPKSERPNFHNPDPRHQERLANFHAQGQKVHNAYLK